MTGRPRNRWQDEVRKEGRKTSWGNWVEGKSTQQRRMGEDPENGKESPPSAHANECTNVTVNNHPYHINHSPKGVSS